MEPDQLILIMLERLWLWLAGFLPLLWACSGELEIRSKTRMNRFVTFYCLILFFNRQFYVCYYMYVHLHLCSKVEDVLSTFSGILVTLEYF